jgi:predicted dehydrogenase
VAFAVPPAVQPQVASLVARLGRPLLLEKPLASDLEAARQLVEVIEETGVATQLVLTLRYTVAIREFLADARAIAPEGGYAQWISGGTLAPDAAPWRRQAGALLDVGPHVLDLLDAALGRIRGVRAHGTGPGWVGLLLDHEGGAVSQVSLSSQVAVAQPVCRVAVGGRRGGVALDALPVDEATGPRIVAEFAATVRDGGGHPLDAHHGLRLQEILASAAADLRAG